ncbi:dienelactone hydrolase family protein [Verrucomicrobiales bacterium]|jgi:predicted peptidase|nr:dienelactone hydrolase family protein [Verrucomicrobiales bacterium]|tara:strand:- start:403 stop:1191 length:789 start_codon:yes stop_codon:yes gene_type:complete
MKCLLVFSLCFLFGILSADAQIRIESKIHRLPETEVAKTISLNPDYHVFGEALADGDEKLPLLMVLHGGGGTGLEIGKVKGAPIRLIHTMKEAKIKSIVVAPQAAKSPMKVGAKGGWVPTDLDVLLAHLLKTLPVDANRVYLTGSSMGGYGTYVWAGVSPGHFAAIAPMVGGLGALGPKDITSDLDLWGKNLATLPMKTYYGAEDRVVPADRGKMILEAITKAGGTQAELIIFDDMGHNAGQRPYSDPEFFRWLFSHKREQK